jgi:2-amino-4-hydroxy-6-hydroxymethyldihydropteridine diphosphokinase
MNFLGIGSNLNSKFGDRFKNINLSIKLLNLYKINVLKQSSFYETPSYPDETNPKFINIVVMVSTKLSTKKFISTIISIEEKLERKRSLKNEPRTFYYDIIDYNGKITNFSYNNLILTFTHEELNNRNFVLYPLKEVSPEWEHPKNKEKIDNLIKNLSEHNRKSILKIINN